MKKQDMREHVRIWLERILTEHYRHMKVQVFDSHKTKLYKLISNLGLQKFFPQFNSWDMKVDITVFTVNKDNAYIALSGLKLEHLALADVGEFLGYTRVVNPILSILISPEPPVDPLITLLKDYGRLDLLQYGPHLRHIRIGKWDFTRNEVIPGSILPPGKLL